MATCRIEEATTVIGAGSSETKPLYQFVDCDGVSETDMVRIRGNGDEIRELEAQKWMKEVGINPEFGIHSDVAQLALFANSVLLPFDRYLDPKNNDVFSISSPFDNGNVREWCNSTSACLFQSPFELARNFFSKGEREERASLFIQRANQLLDSVARNRGDYSRLAIDPGFERSFVSEPFQYYTRAARTLLGAKTEDFLRLEARFEAYRTEKERIGLEILAHIGNLHELALCAQDRGIGEKGEAPSLAAISLRQRLETFERIYPGLLEVYRSLEGGENTEALEGASKIRFALDVAGKTINDDGAPVSIKWLLEGNSDLELSGS